MNQDDEHLQLLSIFHYVVAGLTALFACFPLLHLALGLAMLFGKIGGAHPPPRAFGWIFVLLPGCLILCGWTLAVFMALAGRKLSRRRSWTFCFVIAAIECAIVPFGTVLGVFTLVVLMRPSIKERFGVGLPVPPVPPVI